MSAGSVFERCSVETIVRAHASSSEAFAGRHVEPEPRAVGILHQHPVAFVLVQAQQGLVVALGMRVSLGRDLITDFAAKSETDTLSGLFNRRGFEQRIRQRLARWGWLRGATEVGSRPN